MLSSLMLLWQVSEDTDLGGSLLFQVYLFVFSDKAGNGGNTIFESLNLTNLNSDNLPEPGSVSRAALHSPLHGLINQRARF